MDILYVILTALLVVAAVTMILKKVDTRLTFLFLGVIGLAAATIVTGQSVLGDSTTGNVWLDIFEVIRAKFVSTISGTGIRLMMIGGYVMLMNHTKAADVLALGASKLLKPIKNPYIVLALVYMIGAVLKIFITSQIALGLLFMATMFPILTRMGVSKLSAAAACVAIGGMDLGPNDSTGIFAATEILNCTPMDWFTNYELIIGPVIIVCVGIFMGIWFQYMDKKEFGGLVIPEEAKEDMKISDLGVPAFYGVFPLIPLTLVVVFSFVDGIKMDVITAHIICFFLFFIVDLIVKKDMNRLQDNLKKLWVWMGNYFNNIIVLISVASVFAEAIKKLKGIDVLCGMLSHIGGAVIIVAIAMARHPDRHRAAHRLFQRSLVRFRFDGCGYGRNAWRTQRSAAGAHASDRRPVPLLLSLLRRDDCRVRHGGGRADGPVQAQRRPHAVRRAGLLYRNLCCIRTLIFTLFFEVKCYETQF